MKGFFRFPPTDRFPIDVRKSTICPKINDVPHELPIRQYSDVQAGNRCHAGLLVLFDSDSGSTTDSCFAGTAIRFAADCSRV